MPKSRAQYDIEMLQRELQYQKRIEELCATVTTNYESVPTAVMAEKVAVYLTDTFD